MYKFIYTVYAYILCRKKQQSVNMSPSSVVSVHRTKLNQTVVLNAFTLLQIVQELYYSYQPRVLLNIFICNNDI